MRFTLAALLAGIAACGPRLDPQVPPSAPTAARYLYVWAGDKVSLRIDLRRESWPHGATGEASAHAALFR